MRSKPLSLGIRFKEKVTDVTSWTFFTISISASPDFTQRVSTVLLHVFFENPQKGPCQFSQTLSSQKSHITNSEKNALPTVPGGKPGSLPFLGQNIICTNKTYCVYIIYCSTYIHLRSSQHIILGRPNKCQSSLHLTIRSDS